MPQNAVASSRSCSGSALWSHCSMPSIREVFAKARRFFAWMRGSVVDEEGKCMPLSSAFPNSNPIFYREAQHFANGEVTPFFPEKTMTANINHRFMRENSFSVVFSIEP